MVRYCVHCGVKVTEPEQSCQRCGADLVQGTTPRTTKVRRFHCTTCRSELSPGNRFCPTCGARFASPVLGARHAGTVVAASGASAGQRWFVGIALVWNVLAHGWTLLVLLGVAGVLGNVVFVAETDALVMLVLDGIGLLLLVGAGIALIH